jgi:uncharacterized protein (TIGR02145 family)
MAFPKAEGRFFFNLAKLRQNSYIILINTFDHKGASMKIKRTIFTLAVLFPICHALAINISGIVKNSEGIGMEGVAVRLGKANRATTTGSNGSFTLKDGTNLQQQSHHTALRNDCPLLLEDNRFFFNMTEKSEVKVMAYDCNGKLIVSYDKVVVGGNFSLALPHFGSGIQIFRVSVNNEPYTFKSVTGITTKPGPASSVKEIGFAKQAKATAPIDDALLFIKAGYRLYRIAVTKPDTSGLQITMVPLDTGTVTDADGNMYKTVRIGNQYWTAENLLTTKYNDGSSIGSACNFYNNTTDAAAKKKWGAFYNFSAVKTGKLAPKGWHVPTNAEWDTLQNYLIAHGYNDDGTTSGNRIAKSMASTTDWQVSGEPGALSIDLSINNASGFSALPAGWHYWDGVYKDRNICVYWWTATAKDSQYSYIAGLWNNTFNLDRAYYTLIEVCVRIVRDN